ncbi:MAG: hypothetical protein ACJ78U_16290, partial [Myxococcales bacterium]
GRFTGAMVPMSVADELADLLSAATALGPGKSLAAKVRNAQVAGGSGDVAGTCAALGDFLSEVAAQAEKKIPATAARVLSAEAEAARSALACQ